MPFNVFKDSLVIGIPVGAIEDHADNVSISHRLSCRMVHVLIQSLFVLRVNSRRINKHELKVSLGVDAEQSMSRRLGLAGGDTDFLTQYVIQQGRFTDVRAPNYGNNRRFFYRFCHCSLSNICCAEVCSARRRLLALAVSFKPLLGTRHSTTKTF